MSARELRMAGASVRRRLARLTRPQGVSERLLRSNAAWLAPLEPGFAALADSPLALPLPGGEQVRERAAEPVRSQASASPGGAGRGRAGDPVAGRNSAAARGTEQGRGRLAVLPVAAARRQERSGEAADPERPAPSAASLGMRAEPETTSSPALLHSARAVGCTTAPEVPPAPAEAAALGRVRALEPRPVSASEHCRTIVQLGELVLAAERALGARAVHGAADLRVPVDAELSADAFSPEQLARALLEERDAVSVARRTEPGDAGRGVAAGGVAGAAATAAVASAAAAVPALPPMPRFLFDTLAPRAAPPGLGAGELAEHINDVLREQARRQGVDLV